MARYDQVAAEFATLWGELRLERALDAFCHRLGGGHRVLDLGCGSGRDIGFLAELGCHVVGLDLSLGMLIEARHRLPDSRLVRADLRLLPFASCSFDGVWACASLLHLPRPQFPHTLREIARVLHRPGGVLYLALKGGQGEQWLADGHGRRSFFAYYQLPEIETVLCQTGFHVCESWSAPDKAGRDKPWMTVIAAL